MAVPNYQEFMLPALKLGTEGVIKNRDAPNKVADAMSLSEEDKQELDASGRKRRFTGRTIWAIFHLCQAGLLKRPSRGHFTITERSDALPQARIWLDPPCS